SSVGDAYKYLNRRAAELCPDGFDVLEENGDNPTTSTYAHYDRTSGVLRTSDVHKADVSARIRCHAGSSGEIAAAPPPSPAVVAESDPPADTRETRAPLRTGVDARRAFAQELDEWLGKGKPAIRVSTEGEDGRTLILRSKNCGVRNADALSQV